MLMEFQAIAPHVIMFKLKTHFGIEFPYYLVQHKHGNFLVECPESLPKELESKMHSMGGVNYIFISHRDGVGKACEYKKAFNAKIIIHKNEERYVEGCKADLPFEMDVPITKNVEVIHIPGHTPGNSCLFFKDYGYLFTGDQICVHNNGKPFVYMERHSPTDGQISEKEVNFILAKLKSKKFDKIFSLFGLALNDAKTRLFEQSM